MTQQSIPKLMLDWATAAIMRNGLIEMKNFCLEFFENAKPETFFQESAGVADLMTSCMLSISGYQKRPRLTP